MEISPRTYKFLQVNAACLIVFFFTFTAIVFLRPTSPQLRGVQYAVGALLLVCGLLTIALHWTLVQGIKGGVIEVRAPRVLTQPAWMHV